MYEYLKELKLSKFVVFDTETTGLNPATNSIIEFSAILFENGKQKNTLAFLCNPGVQISNEIENLTGITNEMLIGQDTFDSFANAVLDFFGDLPIVGHNLSFDMSFLKHEMYRCGKINKLSNTLYDTLLLSRAFYFYLPNHKLGTLAEYCGFSSEGAHRAEADAFNTGRVFIRLIDEAMLYDAKTFETIVKILKRTKTPNKELYKNLLDKAKRDKRLLTKRRPKISWKAKSNITGNSIDENNLNVCEEDITNELFGKGGRISAKLKNYEPRPQQIKMAEIVFRTMGKNKVSMIEAGTGVGKSLAYLVPAVLQLNKTRKDNEARRVVIATNTKNLQEQIFYKEIPFIQKQLKLPFKAVLLKGRNNYICLTRWKNLLTELQGRIKPDLRASLIPVVTWLQHTKTGDIYENTGFNLKVNWWLWKEICSEPGYCTTDRCKGNDWCYLGKIRRNAIVSDLVIVNHSLLFADAASENSIMPGYTDLIVDEAHNIEKNAYTFYAMSINFNKIAYMLSDLEKPGSAGVGYIKDIANIAKLLKKEHDIKTYLDSLHHAIEKTRQVSEVFFTKIAKEKFPTIPEKEKVYGVKKRYKDFYREFEKTESLVEDFIIALDELSKSISEVIIKVDTLSKERALIFDNVKTNLKNMIGDILEYKMALDVITQSNDPDMIFWYEMDKKGSEKSVEFYGTPLNISEKLYNTIYKELCSVVFTSATLKIFNSFEYFRDRIGISYLKKNDVATVSVGSPYDYEKQMKFIVYTPTEGRFNSYYTNSQLILALAKETKKGILFLFTSYSSLKKVYNEVYTDFKKMGIKLLAQGMGTNRTALLEQFKEEKRSVLFGTDSFWEGVDVQGEALQILIVEKIPFAVPSEPIVEANNEELQNQNRNAFMEYYLPEAILKVRQGIGRLIRTSTDHGVVIFLDNRIDTKRYGGMIKKSIFTISQTITGKENLINQINEFFENWKQMEN